MENKFYVYIYLNPLKPGNYDYQIYHFGYAPFYIGKGCGNRCYFHLNEAKNINFDKVKRCNTHKIRTIRKIWKNNLKPIIIKLINNLTNEEACLLEKHLIKLIGRADLQLGILTNQTDGGEGLYNLSTEIRKSNGIKISNNWKNKPEEEKKQRVYKFKKTLKENPDIMKNATIKVKRTKQNNPESIKYQTEKRKKTLENDPNILKNQKLKRQKTLENNPNIMINVSLKIKKFYKDNPDKKIEQVEKFKITHLNKLDDAKQKWKNNLSTSLKNRTSEEKIKSKEKRKNTFQDNPEIEIQKQKKFQETLKNNPNILIIKALQTSESWKNKSKEEYDLWCENISKAKKNRTEDEVNKSLEKFRNTIIADPTIYTKRTEKIKKFYKNNPEKKKQETEKSKQTKLLSKQIKVNCIKLILKYNLNYNIKELPRQGKLSYWQNLEKEIINQLK